MLQDPNGHHIAYIYCRFRYILKDRMKGYGETANHTRKPPAKYRVNIFQKYIYIEKFDGRQATIAKWAFSDVAENQTNRTKIKNDACRLFRGRS